VSDAASGTTDGIDADADEFDPRPGREALVVVLLPGMFAVLSLLTGAPFAGAFGVLGLVLLLAGVLRGRRSAVAGGAVALFGGVLLAGLLDATPELLLLAAAASLVAWDAAEHAVGLGEAVGRRADARGALVVHTAGSGLLATLGAGVAYGAFRGAGGGSPLALVLLLAGAVALASVLRP
jgi:hypothetical protein